MLTFTSDLREDAEKPKRMTAKRGGGESEMKDDE